jgi:hypothetical protein
MASSMVLTGTMGKKGPNISLFPIESEITSSTWTSRHAPFHERIVGRDILENGELNFSVPFGLSTNDDLALRAVQQIDQSGMVLRGHDARNGVRLHGAIGEELGAQILQRRNERVLMCAWDEYVVGGDAQLNLSEMDFLRVGLGVPVRSFEIYPTECAWQRG